MSKYFYQGQTMEPSKKWTRDDYARMIGLRVRNKRKKLNQRGSAMFQKGGAASGVLIEAAVLSQMLGNHKGAKRDALIDALSDKEVKAIGKIFARFLGSRQNLPKAQFHQLIRDHKLIDALIRGNGKLATRKKILKQKGGFSLKLLPLAAKGFFKALGRKTASSIVEPITRPLIKKAANKLADNLINQLST